MFVSDLALNDFRSYRELVVTVPKGAVIFQGRNGRGKTNLVEAIGYLSTLSSHRVHADKALVRASDPRASAAVIRTRLHDGDRSSTLELEIVAGKANRARINRGQVSPRELIGRLRTVTFAPEDLQLLRGDPAGRRRLLDEVITQIKPSFAKTRSDFDRVLKQRAAALKQGGSTDSFSFWNDSLAQLSAQIAAHRMSLVTSLAPGVANAYLEVSENDKSAEIAYDLKLLAQEKKFDLGSGPIESPPITGGFMPDLTDVTATLKPRYLDVINHYFPAETRRGANLVGAHRDDLQIFLGGLPAKGYASHGETWSLILALRLAQMNVLATEDSAPVLILDDVFAELDGGRRTALVQQIKPVEQVFITCAVATDIPEELEASRFQVTWDLETGSTVVPVE